MRITCWLLKSGIARCVSAELMAPKRKRQTPSSIRVSMPLKEIEARSGELRFGITFPNTQEPSPTTFLWSRGATMRSRKSQPEGLALSLRLNNLPQRVKRARNEAVGRAAQHLSKGPSPTTRRSTKRQPEGLAFWLRVYNPPQRAKRARIEAKGRAAQHLSHTQNRISEERQRRAKWS